jgi:hypothetical protein
MQAAAPGLLPKPGAHGVHATAPPLGEKVPMGHAYAAPKPGAGAKKPPAANVQETAPAGAKEPAGHLAHTAGVLAPAPAVLAVPAAHGTQLKRPAVGPKLPGAQGAQAPAAAASGAGLAVPAAQYVGSVEFAGQKAPAGHGTGE